MICHFCSKEIEGDNDTFVHTFVFGTMIFVCETCGKVIEAVIEEIGRRHE